MKQFVAILLLIAPLCNAQIRLSDQAEISVLTLGPWQGELFTAFGHSSFRVSDPVRRIDAAYNYGVFDFDQPHFYLNFARGNNLYMLGVMDYPRFEYSYIYYNRYIHEQVLNLTPERKQRLFDFLEWNSRPENKDYLYDYFYDNCATKIPEVMKTVFGDTVIFNDSHITTDYSIRELTDLYLKHQPWGDLGIDICLGLPTDKKATPYEYMFLPDYVEAGFANATISVNGRNEPLVSKTNIIYTAQPEDPPSNVLLHPVTVFSLLLLIAAIFTYRDLKRKKLSNWIDGPFFGLLGLIGLILLLLWTATNHEAAAKNFNLLWAIPTHLLAVYALIRRKKWLTRYFQVVLIVTGLLLITWPLIPQKLNVFLIPLILAIGLRAFTQYRIRAQAG